MITDSQTSVTDWSTPATSAWVIRERVAYERLSLLMRVGTRPMLAGAAFGAVIAVVLSRHAGLQAALLWYGALLVLTALRVWQGWRFRRDPHRRARVAVWQRGYLLLLVPYTLVWAAALVGFGHRLDGFEFAFVLCSLLGVLSIGIYTTHSVFAASLTWVLSGVIPVELWTLLHLADDPAMPAMAVGVAAFAVVVLSEAYRSSLIQGEMLRLRLENAAVAEERRQALEQAEQAGRAKSRFLATISHEMRTPLNGIVGITELLRDEVADPHVRERAGVVLRSAEQLDRVIGELLELSRLEFGRFRLEAEPFDPRALLDAVLALSGPRAAESGTTLVCVVDPGVPGRVSADPGRVKLVVHTLLAGALDAAGGQAAPASARVRLSALGNSLVFSVEVAGDVAALQRPEALFDPAERPEGGSDDRHLGGGLGLPLARRLARALGGDIRVLAAGAGGLRFEFEFAAPPVVAAPPAPAEATGAALPLLSGRALVVDDDDVNALVAGAMLERLGLQAERARDGDEALVQLARGRVDVVLMDCRMPRLDGWEATRRWRELERRAGGVEAVARLPILGVSANASDEDRRRCLDAGMDAFVPKPLRLPELAQVLERWLPARGAD